MKNVVIVHVCDCWEDLDHNNSDFIFFEDISINEIEQASPFAQLSDNIEIIFLLVDIIEFDDVGMVHFSQNFELIK